MRSRSVLYLIVLSITLMLTREVSAESVTFTVFSVPESLHTYALGINDSGQIVGYYSNTDGTFGFSLVGGGLSTIDVAGAPPRRRAPQGSSDPGKSTGWRLNDRGSQYFNIDKGKFNLYEFPGRYKTRVHGISSEGHLVGLSGQQGFSFVDGKRHIIRVPGTYLTYPNGINKEGNIVGWFWNGGKYSGFMYDGSSFNEIEVPNANATYAYGINDLGQVVGYYTDDRGDHGFVLTDGNIKTIDFPDAYQTIVYDINDKSQIVGCYSGEGGRHGFTLKKGGKFGILDVPGATSTYAYGVNNAGLIVGYCYVKYNRKYSGFVAAPDDVPTIENLDNITLNKTHVLKGAPQ